LRAEADGASMCYTSDTSPGEHTLRAAKGVDLLVAEATLPEEYAGVAPHLTAVEAGTLAKDAGAGALVLVHIWPTNDRDLTAELASRAYGGPVVVAREFDEFDITPPNGRDD